MATMPFIYTGPSGQINFVGIIQRSVDGLFSASGSPTFSSSLTFVQKQIVLNEVSGMPGLYQKSLDVTPWLNSEYIFLVHDSGTQLCLGATNFYLSGGVECGPSGNTNLILNEPLANHLGNGSVGSGLNKIQQDIYFSNIKLVNNSSGPNNEYSAIWYKNGFELGSGNVNDAAITVYNTETGANLLLNVKMANAGPNLSALFYTETVNLMQSGVIYLAAVSGTIDSSTQKWKQLVGLDLM